MLESKASDIRVVMTRTRDTDVGLNQRSVIANKAKAHLFVSIHCNSLANVKRDGPKIWGAETYVMSLNKLDDNREIAQKENADILLEENYKEVYKGFDPSDPRATISIDLEQAKHLTGSIEMAKMVQKHLASTAGRKDKGVKQAGFWVICYNTMPSVLTEIGYLSNATEEAFLHSEKGQKQIAQALCDAILEYKARFYDATGGNTSSASSIESVMSAVLSDPSEGQGRDAASAVQYCVQLTASPKALDVPDIDSYTGLMHTLFTLEDRYGLEVCECEDEVHLRVHIHKGRDAAELHRMLAAWGAIAAKLKAGKITKEEYDRWRYRYPELDTSGQWHKITPSQELSDMLLADLKEHSEE